MGLLDLVLDKLWLQTINSELVHRKILENFIQNHALYHYTKINLIQNHAWAVKGLSALKATILGSIMIPQAGGLSAHKRISFA